FLKQRLRKTDHIGRYGGEEFAVVLPDTDLDAARLVLDEIRQRFAEIHYPAQPTDLRCTFSCGIAELTPDLDIKSMAKQADEALYRASGRYTSIRLRPPCLARYSASSACLAMLLISRSGVSSAMPQLEVQR
ncbi:GGDEF domain-containing protein, partial [Pseudomonas aeruginosa]